MQIVIDIPESMYEGVMIDRVLDTTVIRILDEIKKGTPLPKNHGRLIDADSLDIPVDICDGFEAMDYIDGADTIIEADKAESEDKE